MVLCDVVIELCSGIFSGLYSISVEEGVESCIFWVDREDVDKIHNIYIGLIMYYASTLKLSSVMLLSFIPSLATTIVTLNQLSICMMMHNS